MKIRKSVLGSLMFSALAIAVCGTWASADEVYKGTFELPTAAYWGGALLPPGQYTVSMEENVSESPVVYLHGQGISKTCVATAAPGARGASDRLKIDEVNGTSVVKELDAGTLGKKFEFPVKVKF